MSEATIIIALAGASKEVIDRQAMKIANLKHALREMNALYALPEGHHGAQHCMVCKRLHIVKDFISSESNDDRSLALPCNEHNAYVYLCHECSVTSGEPPPHDESAHDTW